MSEQSVHDIERSLEQERMALAQSLVQLRERVRPANLLDHGKQALTEQAAPYLSRLDGVVRAKPLAAAIAGVAVAAMIFGRRSQPDLEAAAATPAMAGTRFEALTRWEDEGGPPAPEPVDPEEHWLAEARGLRTKAHAMLRQIDDAARRGLAPAAELAKHRAEVLAALASDTRSALGKGLGSLSDAARDQAIAARERLYIAKTSLAETGRKRVDANPLAVGAALAAAGAVVACLFPQTETEDRLLGEASDQLAQEVKGLAKREVMKASALGTTLSSALKTDLKHAARLFDAGRRDDRPVRTH